MLLLYIGDRSYCATGRPNLTATWNSTFQANNFDVILYPGFAHSIPPVDAAGELLIWKLSIQVFVLLTSVCSIQVSVTWCNVALT